MASSGEECAAWIARQIESEFSGLRLRPCSGCGRLWPHRDLGVIAQQRLHRSHRSPHPTVGFKSTAAVRTNAGHQRRVLFPFLWVGWLAMCSSGMRHPSTASGVPFPHGGRRRSVLSDSDDLLGVFVYSCVSDCKHMRVVSLSDEGTRGPRQRLPYSRRMRWRAPRHLPGAPDHEPVFW